MTSWLSRSRSCQHNQLSVSSRDCSICSSSRHTKVPVARIVPLTITCSSAGQLGRKLREWGVYKYDTKNRPSSPVRSVPEGSSTLGPAPIFSFDAKLQGLPEQFLPVTDGFAYVPPSMHDIPSPDADSRIRSDDLILACRNAEGDVSWCVDNSKSHFHLSQSCHWHQLTQGCGSTANSRNRHDVRKKVRKFFSRSYDLAG